MEVNFKQNYIIHKKEKKPIASNRAVVNNMETKEPSKKMSKLQKGLIGYFALMAVNLCAATAYAIGRNPAKAAKVLKGNSIIHNPVYKKGLSLTEEIINKKGNFKTKFDDILSLFDESKCLAKDLHIRECPKEKLPSDRIIYHGTLRAGKIYQNGFSPFASRQISMFGRELGAGVYFTPDIEVASYFTQGLGSIIPVKYAEDMKIAFLNEKQYHTLWHNLKRFISERVSYDELKQLPPMENSALSECLLNKVFKKAGYDAVYIDKGVKESNFIIDLTPDINKVIGKNQSQLVVFSPEKTEIVSRSFKERVSDLKLKANTFISQFKYGIKQGIDGKLF